MMIRLYNDPTKKEVLTVGYLNMQSLYITPTSFNIVLSLSKRIIPKSR